MVALPASVKGRYRNIKSFISYFLIFIYLFTPWIRWYRGDGVNNQAVLIDLPSRKIFLFGLEIVPQDIYLLSMLLIALALSLFAFTSIFGRVWCGFFCPHTVFVDLFMRLERLSAKIFAHNPFLDKTFKHISWFFLSFTFSFGWISYFNDVTKISKELISLSLTGNALLWMLGLTASTYLFAGLLRERVCVNMCPYGRFQSAMIESGTLLVRYDEDRGEPRGKLKDSSSGDCINCNRCVSVCPMGIDIRDGLQMACIGCCLCIDACDEIMMKVNKEPGLVSYSQEPTANNANESKSLKPSIKAILYFFVLLIIFTLTALILTHKKNTDIFIEKDTRLFFSLTPEGKVRNSYIIKIRNNSFKAKDYTIFVLGLEDYGMKMQGSNLSYHKKLIMRLEKETSDDTVIFIETNAQSQLKKRTIYFVIKDDATDETYEIKTIFAFRN